MSYAKLLFNWKGRFFIHSYIHCMACRLRLLFLILLNFTLNIWFNLKRMEVIIKIELELICVRCTSITVKVWRGRLDFSTQKTLMEKYWVGKGLQRYKHIGVVRKRESFAVLNRKTSAIAESSQNRLFSVLKSQFWTGKFLNRF